MVLAHGSQFTLCIASDQESPSSAAQNTPQKLCPDPRFVKYAKEARHLHKPRTMEAPQSANVLLRTTPGAITEKFGSNPKDQTWTVQPVTETTRKRSLPFFIWAVWSGPATSRISKYSCFTKSLTSPKIPFVCLPTTKPQMRMRARPH